MIENEARQRLLGVLGHPRSVELAAEHWIGAAVLGGLRQACNDTLRSDHRDRGVTKNAAGDVQGCLGELLVGTLIERELPEATVRVTPLDWDSPGDEVDATVEIASHTFLIETKCHLHEPQKRRFLINSVAAERSQARGARSFVPIFSALGSSLALMGRPLLIGDVLQWPEEDFGYGDPARSAKLTDLIPKQFGLSFDSAVEQLQAAGAVADPQHLDALAAKARLGFSELRKRGLQIGTRPAAALEALLTVA